MIKSTRQNRVKRSSFTLIELLIVIGLLGALTALILPSLMANREDALGDVCDYNQAGTVRVLKQFYQVYHHYPAGMHTGLQSGANPTYPMAGLPSAQLAHMGTSDADCPSATTLSENQIKSLAAAGIEKVCNGTGYNLLDVDGTINVVRAHNGTGYWLDDDPDGPKEMTFDGVSLENWEVATGTPSWDQRGGAGIVVVLWIAPTIDWENHDHRFSQF
ncbi:MAG: type II secretion system protein [Lentisphaeria bacterium]